MKRTMVLDHGYLEIVGSWGSEEEIIEAARMSTGKGFLGWGSLQHGEGCTYDVDDDSAGCDCSPMPVPGDEKLLRFLWENGHHTPFEMAGLTIQVQAPIFVFREWHRHRVPFSYNEMSARYAPLPDVNYVPSVLRLMTNAAGTNKQAGVVVGATKLTIESAENFRHELQRSYVMAEDFYQWALLAGVPKELARVHLPVGRYSRMRASSNLRGWLNFIKLRAAPAAQWEIRQYAIALSEVIATLFPRTWALFKEVA